MSKDKINTYQGKDKAMSKPSHKIGMKHGHDQDLSIYDFGTDDSLMLINNDDDAEPEPAEKASGSNI